MDEEALAAFAFVASGMGDDSSIRIPISLEFGFEYIDGDHEDTEFFPDGNQWLPENTDNLRKAHEKILSLTQSLFDQGKNVVVDYIIFGQYREFLHMFRDAFGDQLSVKVLFPTLEELVKRDHERERESWTTGIDRIRAVYEELQSLEGEIGAENYLDTTGQTSIETCVLLQRYLNISENV